MVYGIRDGDVISLDNEKAGALTMSVPLTDYRAGGDPAHLWENQPAIRTVTGEIAREVGSIPIHHFRRVDDNTRERITDSLVSGVLRLPAPGYGAARFFEQLILDMTVFDRWAVVFDTDDKGRLRFRRLPAHRVSIGMYEGRRVGVWFHPLEGSPYLIPLDKVVFDVAPSALPDDATANRLTPSPRILTLSDVSDELDAVTQWRHQVLKNGARVPAVIERPVDAPKWDDGAWNRFKSDMSAYKQGGGSEGGIPILEDGMKLHAADVFNPKDFDTAGMRNMTLLEACLLFNYPPELLGAREGTYSNVDAFREAKYRDVLGSWIVNLEQALNVGFLEGGWMKDDEYVEMNVDAKLRGTFDQEAKALMSATGRPWMVTNEARARKNLPPVPGGDDLVTPLNVVVGGLASPIDTAPDDPDNDLDAAPKA